MIVGRNGVNIGLAMQVTGYNIDFHRIEKNIEDYEEGVELLSASRSLVLKFMIHLSIIVLTM